MIDCLIVGAGPAGLTAALYLRRFHRDIRVVALGDSRALKIRRTHNYPGFPAGVAGAELLQRLRQQVTDVGGTLLDDEVVSLERPGASDWGFVAMLKSGVRIESRHALLATGVLDTEPALDGLDDLRGRDLLRQCPICDGHEFSGRRIAVIGRGDHGAREALFLRQYSDHIVLLDSCGDELASDERCRELADAGVRRHTLAAAAVRVDADGVPVRLHLSDGQSLDADTVYAALGNRPRSELAERLGAELDPRGAIVTDAHLRTRVPGLWAAGDVVSALDQIVVATGHGAIAATDIHNALRQSGR